MAQPPASQIAPSVVESIRRTDGVATTTLPADLQLRLMRSLPNPRDRSLSRQALEWFERVQEAHRPVHLFDRYPRVANRIALCWDDKELLAMLFADLLSDRRGGRRGFPAAVKCEMLALHDAANLACEAATAMAGPVPQKAALPETEAA